MPFPAVKYCLICTDIRPGTRGKLNIDGFLGLSPEVFIDVDFPPGIVELSYLMQTGAGDGETYGVSFRIIDEAGNPHHTQPSESFVAQALPKIYLVFQAVRVLYPRPGRYRLQLLVDGTVHYEAPFELFLSSASSVDTNAPAQVKASDPHSGTSSNVEPSTSTKEERSAVLQASVDALFKSADGFEGSAAHLLPDGILMQLGYDVYTQAVAVLLVTAGAAPRAAVANARSALEAAIDMLVLVADSSQYDEWGASIRVCELLANEDNRKYSERAAAATRIAPPVVPSITPEEAVELEGQQWELHNPGMSIMYGRVLAQARQKRRWKYHWSGMRYFPDRVDYVVRKNAAPAGFREMATTWYRILSLAVHPGPRTGRHSLYYSSGRPLVGPKEGDDALPLAAARWACDHAVTAMDLRRTLFPFKQG